MDAKYKRLAAQLTELIATNLQSGIYKLPTEAELGRRYHVSRQTVRQALSLLSSQGLITTRQGSGSYATGFSENGSGRTIALLIRSEQEYMYPELTNQLRLALSEKGYTLQVFSTENQVAREREILTELLALPPKGIFVEPCKSALPTPNTELFDKLHRQDIPFVFLYSCYSALPWAVCVKSDNDYGGYLLAQHLSTQGHTQIAGMFQIDDLQGIERYHGFLNYMRDAGHMLPDDRIGWFTSSELNMLEQKQDSRFLSEFIHRQLPACTAILCQNDEIAYWMIKELAYAGLKVPQDVTVVCFGESYLSELSHIRITALTHRPHAVARCAADCMLRSLQKLAVSSQEIPWELAIRESDAALES